LWLQISAVRTTKEHPLSESNNIETVRAAFARLDAVMESHETLYGSDWVGHFPGMPPLDAEGHRQYTAVMMQAFPDLDRSVDDVFASGDRVAARWSARGRHGGDFMGIAPTDKVVTSSGITIFRLQDGRIVEEWGESDLLGLMTQLGALGSA
jgi:predicted ester cyclase